MRNHLDQTDLKHMLMPHQDGSIEVGANLTLTIALAALMITNAIEDLAAALRKEQPK